MTVLVTGGTGYLGRAIVAALIAAGHEPVVFSRRATQSGLAARCIDGDVCDAGAVAQAARRCEAICHAAALVAIDGDPRRFDAVNVGALRHVIALAETGLVQRVVYTSSFLALPPAGHDAPLTANDYQRTKVEGLRLASAAMARGVPLICVWPGVVFGPGPRREGNLVGRLIADHLQGRLPGIVGGSRVWSFAFVDDVAAGHVRALERGAPGGRYGLGGHNRPQRALFEWLRDRTGRPLPREIPAPLARLVGGLEQWRARLTATTPHITRGAVEIFSCDWPVDSSAAVRDLGYRITPWDEALTRTLDALEPSRQASTA